MYELNSSGFDMVYYSSFLDDLYSSCPECNLIGGQGGYGVAGDGKIMQGHDYIIIKDNVPVGYYNIEVIADMDVLQNEAILSEDEYINLIKETVKEEYIAAKEELEITRAAKMANNMNSSDDIYVDVAKVFNATIPNLYNITVEDINFQTIVNNIVTGETEYTYSVTDIVFKDSSITLDVGESKIIGYTISPDNATNKNVIWESSNSSIVSVDANGGIIAKSPGNATITVKSVDGNTTKEIIKALETNNINLLAKNMYNVFEEAIEDKLILNKIKNELMEKGACGSLMTGSGSCIYRIFDTKENLKRAYKNLKEKYEVYFAISSNL